MRSVLDLSLRGLPIVEPEQLTYLFAISEQDMECDIDREGDRIECSVRMVETYDGTTRTLTTFAATEGLDGVFIPVTITAGLDKLEPSPGATSGAVEAAQTDDVEDAPTTIVTRPSPAATATESSEPTEAAESTEAPESTESPESESVESSSTESSSTESSSIESSSTEASSTPSPSTSLRTTTSQPTSTTPTPTFTPAPIPENAASSRAKQNAVLVGVAAVVGGIMIL